MWAVWPSAKCVVGLEVSRLGLNLTKLTSFSLRLLLLKIKIKIKIGTTRFALQSLRTESCIVRKVFGT